MEASQLNQVIETLSQFFDREVPRLSSTYNWKIPEIEGFLRSGHSDYLSNIELKKFLRGLWEKSTSHNEKLKIARIIISDWGGVRSNKQATLESYVNMILEISQNTPLKGVASYSKLFAIVRPKNYAIYDARVAACLNAVQINACIERGIAFNYVPGRNNIVGNMQTRQGFTQDPRFNTRHLVKSGWTPIEEDETYEKYLELLHACLEIKPQYDLTSLEMALFSNAERECLKAMQQSPLV